MKTKTLLIFGAYNTQIQEGSHGKGQTQLSILDTISLVSQELLRNILASHIVSGYRTDHNLVTQLFNKTELPKRKLFWKFNNSFLDDKNLISFIKKQITYMKEPYALPVYSRASIESYQDIQFSVTDKLFFETLMSHLRVEIVQHSARRKRMQDGQKNILGDV